MPEPSTDLLDHRAWDSVSDETQIEFLRGGEEMVKATLSLGHAADLRATTVMGIFGAVGVALFAAVATIIAGSHPASCALISAGTTTAMGLFLAAAFSAAAAWPRYFFVAGFEPRNLLNSSARQDQYRTRALIAVTQDRIDYNRRAINRAARLMMTSVCIAGGSLLAGIIVFLVLSFLVGAHHPS
jgi:hypothetical protein